jgi:hypothetical protein
MKLQMELADCTEEGGSLALAAYCSLLDMEGMGTQLAGVASDG